MKTMRRSFAMLLALVMSLSLMTSALALEPPVRGVRYLDGLRVETVNGPYIAPRAAHGTYHYNAREELTSYKCSFPFDCADGIGSDLEVHVDGAIADVPLNIYVYYNGRVVDQYLLMPGEEETTYISSTDGSYLTGSGELVVEPANGGDSVYWVTIYQHT